MTTPTLVMKAVSTFLLAALLLLSLGEAYTALSKAFELPLSAAALIINLPCALCYLAWRGVRSRFSSDVSWSSSLVVKSMLLGFIVLWLLIGVLGFLGEARTDSRPAMGLVGLFMTVILVPVAEEVLFRLALGDLWKRFWGRFWGGYGSILFFSYLHMLPSWSQLPELPRGIPLGVLLMSVVSEWLIQKTSRVSLSILWHACLNATAVFIGVWDPRWLDILPSLFLQTSFWSS